MEKRCTKKLESGKPPDTHRHPARLKIGGFQKPGMVVIDEQHRFGVAQRAKIMQINELIPHTY
jgi:hypothetical protein